MQRRALLATLAAGTAAAGAGCLSPFGVGSDCPRSFSLSLQATSTAETAAAAAATRDELHPVARDLFDRAAAGESVAFTAIVDPPFRERYVRGDDGYYRVRTPVVSTQEVRGYDFEFESSPDVATAATPATTVAFADLPEPDRTAFRAGFGFHRRKIRAAGELSGDTTLAYPDAAARNRSVLVPEPQYDYVEWEGRYVRLDRTGTRQVTVETAEVRVDRVAADHAALAARIYERRGVTLDDADLSTAAHDVLERAAEDEYTECTDYGETTTYSSGLREVRRALAVEAEDGDTEIADYAR